MDDREYPPDGCPICRHEPEYCSCFDTQDEYERYVRTGELRAAEAAGQSTLLEEATP